MEIIDKQCGKCHITFSTHINAVEFCTECYQEMMLDAEEAGEWEK